MSVEQVWHELEQEPASRTDGWVQRRVLPRSSLDVFLALDRPENRRMLRIRVAEASVPADAVVPSSKGVEAIVLNDAEDGGRRSIVLSALDVKYHEVFTSLCADLIGVLEEHAWNEPAAVRAFLGRLVRWQQFLERVGASALSADGQLGLYAELWLLYQDFLAGPVGPMGVQFWTGPERTHQDFQLPGRAIEVKATRQVGPRQVVITSERQLDTTGILQLLLVHTAWDVRRGSASTLPELVDLIRVRLQEDPDLLSLFENRLLAAGYLDSHRRHYEPTGYTLRNETIYEVRPTFPRLTEQSLPTGVSSVRYLIDLAECRPFAVSRVVLTRMITETTHGSA